MSSNPKEHTEMIVRALRRGGEDRGRIFSSSGDSVTTPVNQGWGGASVGSAAEAAS